VKPLRHSRLHSEAGSVAQEDLLAWTDEAPHTSRSVMRRRLTTGTTELRDKWNAGSKDPDVFYAQEAGDSYVYDLTAWHASGLEWIPAVDRFLAGRRGQKLLDYGAGIGTYSLMASDYGLEVEACDVCQDLRNYMHWRAARHGLPMNITARPEGQPYDVLLCLDVVEHLKNPEEFPRMAASWLAPGGTLMVTWTFHQSGGMHPMHHTHLAFPAFRAELARNFKQVGAVWPAVFQKKNV